MNVGLALKDFFKKHVKAIDLTNTLIRLIAGTIFLIVGIILVVKQELFLVPAMYVIGALFIITGALKTFSWFFKGKKEWISLALNIGFCILGILVIIYVDIPIYFIIVVFGIYLLAISVIEFVHTFLVIKNRTKGFLASLISGIFYLTFAVLLIVMPATTRHATFIVIGIYCIMIGGSYIIDFIYTVIPEKAKLKVKRRIHISLPIIFSMFIPHSVLQDINAHLSKEGNKIEDIEGLVGQKGDETPDLEIFFHIADEGFNAVGHCDICFDGEVIAYGNYHEAAQNKFGMGPGVLITTNKDEYIPFCSRFNKTTIFSYGLRLDDEQRELVKNKIQAIKDLTYPWNTPYREELNKNGKVNMNDFKEFASNLDKETHCEFYKFKKGKFKTFFVLTTNCVALAESITSVAGTDILGMTGIISPGTFYEYLDSEYLKNGTMVVSRQVYREEPKEETAPSKA